MKSSFKYLVSSVAVIALSCIQNSIFAQGKPALNTIHGIVVDSSNRVPLDYISIALKERGMAVKSGLTTSDGSFMLRDIRGGSYTLFIVALNFKPKTIDIILKDTLSVLNLGTLLLTPSTNSLQEITITGTKPLIKQEIDRISYDLEADPDSKGNNLLTMMNKVPFLSVDADENVLVKGKSDYKVLINGRPSSMFERNLKDVLKSIPASTIQKIEVITNPSSKYDAEGLAGIINIITTRKFEGHRGTMNIRESFPTGGPGLGGSVDIKGKSLGVSAFGGLSSNSNPQTKNSNYRKSLDLDEIRLSQDQLKKSKGQSSYLGSELSYEINDFNLISAQVNVNGSKSESNTTQSSILNDKQQILQQYELNNNSEVRANGWDVGMNYQLGFRTNKRQFLTLSYQYSFHESDLMSMQQILNRKNYISPDFIQMNIGSAAEQTFQLDYIHPVKSLVVEAGIKGIMRNNKSDFIQSSFNSMSSSFEVDAVRSNRFNNDQNIFGAYNSYMFKLKQLEFKAGFRVEQTLVNADFISSSSKIFQNYLNIIPSVSIMRKFDSSNSLILGFSQRIKRPGINRLNPFGDRSNPSFEKSGNPDLQPALINAIQLSYSRTKKATLNLAVDYSFVKNLFLEVALYDPITRITRTRYENTGKAKVVTTSVYLNYPITKTINVTFNGNSGMNFLEGMNGNTPVKVKMLTYNFSGFTGYNFGKGLRVSASIKTMSRKITSLQGTSNALTTSSFGINKDLIKNRFTFSASISNPFLKYRVNDSETQGPTFFQTNLSQDYFRGFSFSMNYSFGKLKEAIKKTKRGIKNDDLAN